MGIEYEAGRKRGEGRSEGVLFDFRALSLFWVVVALPVWQCKSSVKRKKVPLFACKTELTVELIRMDYCLELKTGTPNICELQTVLSSVTPTSGSQLLQHSVYFSDKCRDTKAIFHLIQPQPDNNGICKLKITKWDKSTQLCTIQYNIIIIVIAMHLFLEYL